MQGLANEENSGRRIVVTRSAPRPGAEDLRFFFVHLMKTGGTTFAFQLRTQFPAEEIYPAPGLDRRDNLDIAAYVSVSRMLRLSPERREAIRMYTGHFPFVASDLLGLDLVPLTLLRDPVDRTISVLKHFKRLTKRYHDLDLAAIYEDRFVFAHFVENHQTRMFSVTAEDAPEAFGRRMSYWATASLLGIGPPRANIDIDDAERERAIADAEEDKVDDARFELARQQLGKVGLVGFSEHYDDFIAELRERFGWWPEGLNTEHKANVSTEGWGVPEELRARIAEDNAYDVKFYEYAKELAVDDEAPPPHRSRPSIAAVPDPEPASTPENARKTPNGRPPASLRESLRASIRRRHPRFVQAVVADAKVTASYRGERIDFDRGTAYALYQAARLAWVSDAFLAQALYRAKARMQALGVPVLPTLAHRLAMVVADVCIGDPVVMQPGVYLAHGQVVIDGLVEIGRNVVIFPWVTIGLRAGDIAGPTIENDVHIGTGAKVIGAVTIHRGARVGANAVVIDDVAPKTTVVGAPARPVGGADL
jgi:serine O-acetyltransferase